MNLFFYEKICREHDGRRGRGGDAAPLFSVALILNELNGSFLGEDLLQERLVLSRSIMRCVVGSVGRVVVVDCRSSRPMMCEFPSFCDYSARFRWQEVDHAQLEVS